MSNDKMNIADSSSLHLQQAPCCMQPGFTLWNSDCLTMLKSIADESVDMVFADPPFDVNIKYNGYKDKRVDYKEWCADWIAECFRILKPTGSFYLMTIDRHLEWKMPIMATHGIFINLIKWRNVSTVASKKQFWPSVQPILLYGKTKDYKFNANAELRKQMLTAKGMPTRWGKGKELQVGRLLDYWDDIKNIYVGSKPNEEAILAPGRKVQKAHPCQMPEMLPGRAILFSTDENDIVLDPFSGSSTTGIACKKLNRQFIGSELSAEYFELSKNRVAKLSEQLF